MLNDIKLDLFLKDLPKKIVLIIKKTFSPVLKNSLRIIMALVTHFDLELHQMDMKIAFLNGDIEEEVFMD